MVKKKVRLDAFEKQIEEELERGEWVRVKNYENLKRLLRESAEAYFKEELKINNTYKSQAK